MIYRAIKKRNGDIYICPAQLEDITENPLTAEQQLIVELDDKIKELEQEKAELMKFVKEMNDLGKLSPMRLSDYTDIIYHGSLALLNNHTDKPDAL